ncbi:MAG: radical SAM protein [Desulfobacteraceae bacterium]
MARKDCGPENLAELYFRKNVGQKVCVTTNGCSENRIDCAKMQKFFTDNGWSVTADIRQADLILFNACGLTTVRENDSLATLQWITEQKRPSAEVIVWGCFPKINAERLRAIHAGLLFDSDQEERLEEFFEASVKSQQIEANFLVAACPNHQPTANGWHRYLAKIISGLRSPRLFLGKRRWARASRLVNFLDSEAFPIKVSTGCLDACAYCGVRLARGRLRSKPIPQVVAEFKDGLARQFSKFTLIGTDLGAYGRDQGQRLVDLLDTILELEGDYKIRLPNINPRWLKDMLPEMRKLVQSNKIEVIGSGVQCGSNRILQLMNRRYRVEDYQQAVVALKAECPALHIRTNLIVGFPGETEGDFDKTLQLVDEVDFTFADIHRYSPRPKTKAATMPDQVPARVIEDRFIRLTRHFSRTPGKT